MLVDLTLEGLFYTDETSGGVLLRERDGTRQAVFFFTRDLMAYIGGAIKRQHQDGLPLAHGAALDVLAEANVLPVKLIIPRLVKGEDGDLRYEAVMYFQIGNRTLAKHLMPSDALCFAISAQCPILMDGELLDRADPIARETLRSLHRAATPGDAKSAEEESLTTPKDKLPQA